MTIQPFTVVTGAAPYLDRTNLDTDIIIRIDRVAAMGREGLGPYAMEALRFRADGSEEPDFILNQSRFRGAPVLLAADNFGCGSSREAAVWALHDAGVRCVIAPSFGDIFFGNCFQNGVLPIRLPAAQIAELASACSDGAPLTIDLVERVVVPPSGAAIAFVVDPMRRMGLLSGLDDIGLTLKDEALIRAWQNEDRNRRPWVWHAGEGVGRATTKSTSI